MSTAQTVLIACKWITTQAPKEWVWIPWEPDHQERVDLPQIPPEWETSTAPIPPVQVGQVWNHKKRTNKKQKGSYRSLFFCLFPDFTDPRIYKSHLRNFSIPYILQKTDSVGIMAEVTIISRVCDGDLRVRFRRLYANKAIKAVNANEALARINGLPVATA